MRGLMTVALCITLAGCGTSTSATNETNGGSAVDTTLTKLTLTSDAFQDGQPIPTQYTCDGANRSPALSWGDPPQGTKSFALVVNDPDAPSGTYRHWGVFDIPASARTIDGGQRVGTEATNDFGKPGYGGPCPPLGHGPHHYHFKLFALDVDRLDLTPQAKVIDVEQKAGQHALAQAELVGTYERK
jgi:Raf kinase inhibitor-like YbhB/YbcL family protein